MKDLPAPVLDPADQLRLAPEVFDAVLAAGSHQSGTRPAHAEVAAVADCEKAFRAYSLDQALLMPPVLSDWVPAGHLAHLISDLVEKVLDLRAIYAAYEERRGAPPYDPRLLTKLLLYGYATGVFSSRRIERAVHEVIPFRYLAGNQEPDHKTISEFRRVHLAALSRLFDQVLVVCKRAGLIKLGHVALDGTKVKANASKHKAMSYGRMKEREGEYAAIVKQWLERAEAEDRAEGERFGRDRRGDELPEELQRAETRLRKLREAKAALEAEAREAAAAAAAEKARAKGGDEEAVTAAAEKADDDAEPAPKAQRNFTDPESRIMLSGDKAFIQAYNCQAVVDDTPHHLIVARAVSNQASDNPHLVPMLLGMTWSTGEIPRKVSADAGYGCEANVVAMAEAGIDAYLAQGRERYRRGEPPPRGRIPAHLGPRERMARKMRTKKGHAVYKRRKHVAEPPHGNIKHRLGFRQFLLRGLEKVNGEWSLVTMGYNLRRLHDSGRAVLVGSW